MDLMSLVNELEQKKATRKDLIVDSRTISAEVNNQDERLLSLRVPDEDGEAYYGMTEWAHKQLSDKLHIPKKYYDRMREDEHMQLLADNINAWLPEKERRLIRIQDDNVRAFLSDRYRVMDNYDLIFSVFEKFKELGTINIVKSDLTETHMYIKATDDRLRAAVKVDDVVAGGVVIRNSEVGASAFAVEPYILRLVCTNGMIGERAMQKVHLGRVNTEVGLIDWSNETLKLNDQALWSEVDDIIDMTFDEGSFNGWVAKLGESAETEIESPVTAVNNIATNIGLSEERKTVLMDYFLREKDSTKYGLVNSITAFAKDVTDVEEQVRLERIGGELIFAPEKRYMELVEG